MFTVEDGTGEDPAANSYASVADFKAYWDDRGFDYSIYTPDSVIEQALIKATDFIERKYGRYFLGCRLLGQVQPLSWPRAYVYLHGEAVVGLPPQLVKATHEYTKIALETPEGLAPNPGGYDTTGQLVSSSTVKVGPIEKTQQYEAGSGSSLRSYPYADGLLAELIAGAGGVIRS